MEKNHLTSPMNISDGGAASLFAKNGNKYVRVATTLKKEDGTSAVGTSMDSKNPAFAKLNKGEPYYGEATVFGKNYDAGYEPIKDASGAVIGESKDLAACDNTPRQFEAG
jgi:methyl-accepting chemotaxis protein-2 (aspartate sensor receptor)